MTEPNPFNRPIGIDLFAGAGGMSLGFEQAGFDVKAAVEIDPVHCATHKFNFPKCAVIPRSVEGLKGSEIRVAAGLGNRTVDVVFGGAFSTPVYHMMCNTPVVSLDQAKGKKMRTAGAAFTGLSDSLGATAVSVPIGDAYSGMQRGSLDCILADPTNLISASFNEVVTDMTVVPLGVVTGANWVWSKSTWAAFSDEEKALIKDEMALALAKTQLDFDASVGASMEDANARGINLHDAGADLGAHIDAFKAQFISNLVSEATTVADAPAIFDQYAALQTAWVERLNGIDRTDEAAVAALIKEHLMSKMPN